MATSFVFTQEQIDEIRRLRENLSEGQNASQPSGAVPLYSYIYMCVSGLDLNDPSYLNNAQSMLGTLRQRAEQGAYSAGVYESAIWLYGAIQVNSSNGASSRVIREYNIRQGQLRGKGTFSKDLLDKASNAVGINLADSILNDTDISGAPNLGQGKLPTVQEIGVNDLVGVRDTLYPGNQSLGSELYLNQAWPGIVMLGALGGKYTDRLLRYDDKNQPIALDTLADWKSLLFTWDSFKTAFRITLNQDDSVTTVSDLLIGMNLAPTLIANAIQAYAANGFSSFAQIVFSALIFSQNTDAGSALNLIAKLDSNKFLDMLAGAAVGESQIGTTTDANFTSRSTTFFGAYGASLQSINATLLPTDARSLVQLARTDVNARAALAALSVVKVQVSTAVAEKLSLFSEATGQGEITESWMGNRAALLEAMLVRDLRNIPGILTGGQGPAFAQGILYEDVSSNLIIRTGAVTDADRRVVWFGGTAADTRIGSALADGLYGGAGDDSLFGMAGRDQLEGGAGADILDGGAGVDTLVGGTGDDVLTGGADTDTLMGGQGFDTYLFSSGFGNDTILDSDGQGVLNYDGVALPGGLKVAGLNGVWEDALRQYVYTLVPNVSGATGGSDLVIGRRTAPGASTVVGTITVKNWQNNQLGINLDATASLPTTPITSVYGGDYIKAIKPDGVTYELLNNNYVSAGASPGAADLIGGFAGADRISGGGGNDALIGNAGDDELDGGDGVDVLLGGDAQHVRVLVWVAFDRGVRAIDNNNHVAAICRPVGRCECVNDGSFWQMVAA